MAIIGQGVQAGLGRVDYTPYLQGAMAGAQGIAQGISGIGQAVSQGVKDYLQKQEESRKKKEATTFFTGFINNNPQIAGSLGIPLNLKGEVDDPGVVRAVIESLGGPDKAISIGTSLQKFEQDMAQSKIEQKAKTMQVAELERTTAERSRLAQAMSASPAQSAIMSGSTFEQLPTAAGSFTSSAPRNTSEFIQRAQDAKIDPSVWLPQAIQFSQVEENVGQAKARGANLGGFTTAEDALKEAERLGKGRKGFAPSFTVVQGRYFPAFREESPAAFETESAKLTAKAAQDQLTKTKNEFSTQIALEQSADMVLKGLAGKAKTGVFAPVFTFAKRVFNDFGFPVDGLNEQLILEKGIAGMQAGQIQALARGLGSMSNADREFFVSSFPNIKDSPEVNRFFAEMAKENAKFAREDQELIRKLEREKVEVGEINRIIEERREKRNVASSIFDRVFSGQPAVQSPAPALGSGKISKESASFIPKS